MSTNVIRWTLVIVFFFSYMSSFGQEAPDSTKVDDIADVGPTSEEVDTLKELNDLMSELRRSINIGKPVLLDANEISNAVFLNKKGKFSNYDSLVSLIKLNHEVILKKKASLIYKSTSVMILNEIKLNKAATIRYPIQLLIRQNDFAVVRFKDGTEIDYGKVKLDSTNTLVFQENILYSTEKHGAITKVLATIKGCKIVVDNKAIKADLKIVMSASTHQPHLSIIENKQTK